MERSTLFMLISQVEITANPMVIPNAPRLGPIKRSLKEIPTLNLPPLSFCSDWSYAEYAKLKPENECQNSF